MSDLNATTPPPLPPEQKNNGKIMTLTMLSHPDLSRIGDYLPIFGSRVHLSRSTPDFQAPGALHGRPIADLYVSREPLQLEIEPGGAVVLHASHKIRLTCNGHDVSGTHRLTPAQVRAGVTLSLNQRVVLFLHVSLRNRLKAKCSHGLVGYGDRIEALRRNIDLVADLQTPVLLRGASGTGKELVARAIHQAGKSAGPLVCMNMGAVPPSLAASELFGNVKGAFTGADRARTGFFLAAHKGTLFMDEVGETPPEVQVLLLRALETGMVIPVGGTRGQPFQARLLAATDADLESKMAEESFKTPLFHRLAGYQIALPTLEERLEDFGRLFMHFARQELEAVRETHRLRPGDPHKPPWLPTHLMERMVHMQWPGNVRQLRNMVRQLVIGSRGMDCLVFEEASRHASVTSFTSPALKRKPSDLSSQEVVTAMQESCWDIKKAAAELGISRAALYLLIDKIPELHRASDLDADTITRALETHQQFRDAAFQLRVSPAALRRRLRELGLTIGD